MRYTFSIRGRALGILVAAMSALSLSLLSGAKYSADAKSADKSASTTQSTPATDTGTSPKDKAAKNSPKTSAGKKAEGTSESKTAKADQRAATKDSTGSVKGGSEAKLLSITSPIKAGSDATVEVRTVPNAACSIKVKYKSGPAKAAGLTDKSADGSGKVSWTWKVGKTTKPGSWPVEVTCSSKGKSSTVSSQLTVQ